MITNRKITLDTFDFSALKGKPEALTPDMIKTLGQAHINKNAFWYRKPRHVAGLRAANKFTCKEWRNNENAQARWQYLIEQFAALPKIDGTLASTIYKMFSTAFNVSLATETEGQCKFVAFPGGVIDINVKEKIKPSDIAKKMQEIIKQHYESEEIKLRSPTPLGLKSGSCHH